MIEWLNQNSGAAISILTSIYVISMIAYVIATIIIVGKMAGANTIMRKQLEAQLEENADRKRPYVVYDIQINDREAQSILQNYSSEPAFNVKVRLDKSIIVRPNMGTGKASPQLASHNIAHLAPFRKLCESLGGSPDFFGSIPNPIFMVTIEYEDQNSKKYGNKYPIDLNYHREMFSRTKSEEC